MLRHLLLAAAAWLTFSSAHAAETTTPAASAAVPDYITAAVADSKRPEADTERDADRKPAQMLVFAGIKPDMKVLEIMPGGGYFMRIFSKALGPKGHLFELVPAPPPGAKPPPDAASRPDPIKAIADDPDYGNVTIITAPFDDFTVPEPVDVVWTSQNYHDFHNPRFGIDMAKVNKDVFDALKPGGIYVVLDHAAAKGAGLSVVATLHRIDEETTKKEVEAAGFKLIAESDVLRNPADPHSAAVFDPSIRGKTDQFLLAFQKPKS